MAAILVLLVEDEGVIRWMTSEGLQDEGFAVVEASNSDEAVQLLDGPGRFDAVVTDVRMPGAVDGVGVAVHARRRYPAIPLIVTSGYAANLIARLGVLDPPAHVIGKPYNLAEVVQALYRLTRN